MRSKLFVLGSLLLLLVSCTPTYIVTFAGSAGGSVSNMGGEYDEGTTVSVSAQPETGYEFIGWSDGSKQNPRTINVSENLNLTARFGKQQFSVSVNTQGEGTVTTSGAFTEGSFEYGSSARFEAVPAVGWEFDSWSGDATGTVNPLSVTVEGPLTVTALFKRQKFDLTVTVEGEGTVAEEVVVQPGQYDYETQVKLTATAKEGWAFAGWTGDVESTENPVTVTITEAKEVTATFIRKKYDLTVTVQGEGTVEETVVVQPGQYDYETQVKLTATAKEGWAFAGWTGDVESTENPITVTITEAKEVTATFIRKKYDLTVTVQGEGTVEETVVVQPGQYDYETQVKLTATSEVGWAFAGWTGDVESTENPVTVTITEAKEVTATFIRKKYDLSITIEGEGTVEETVVVQPGQYDYETQVKLTATAKEGWVFAGWTGDVESTDNPITVTINEAKEVAAEFKFVFQLSSLEINHPMKLDIWNGLGITSNSNVMIDISGELHLISHPADPRGSIEKFFPSLHFIKSDSNWEIQNYFEGINMSFGGRDVHPFGNKGFVWADHGTEVWLAGGDGRPFNNVWTATNISRDNTIWTKVNEYRSFYHGVSSGDLNNDGLDDVIAIHMSTNAPQNDYKYHTYYHVFYQNADGSFEQRFDVLEYPNSPFPSYFSWDDENIENPLGVIRASVLIEDITGDGMPEIIGGASIHKSEWNVPLNAQNGLEIFSDIDSDGRYEILNIQNRIGFWEYDNISASQIKAVDYDNDGDKDLIVNFEGSKGSEYLDSANFNGVQVFNNLGNGQFEFSGIEIPFEDIRISEFELIDVDNDNDLDIVFNANLEIDLGTLNGGVSSSFFYQDQNRLIRNLGEFDENYYSATLDLDEMIYFNDGGSFNKHNNGFEIRILKAIRRITSSQEYIGTGLKTLNATIVSGKLKFYGYLNDIDPAKSDNDLSKYIIKLFEYEPSFD